MKLLPQPGVAQRKRLPPPALCTSDMWRLSSQRRPNVDVHKVHTCLPPTVLPIVAAIAAVGGLVTTSVRSCSGSTVVAARRFFVHDDRSPRLTATARDDVDDGVDGVDGVDVADGDVDGEGDDGGEAADEVLSATLLVVPYVMVMLEDDTNKNWVICCALCFVLERLLMV